MELRKDRSKMALDGLLCHQEPFSYLFVRIALHDQVDDLLFSIGNTKSVLCGFWMPKSFQSVFVREDTPFGYCLQCRLETLNPGLRGEDAGVAPHFSWTLIGIVDKIY